MSFETVNKFGDIEKSFEGLYRKHVSTAGDDANEGALESQPKRTIQAAYDSITNQGTAVLVHAGSYSETLTFASAIPNVGILGEAAPVTAPLTFITQPVTVSGATNTRVRMTHFGLDDLVTIDGTQGRHYFTGCAFNGGLTFSGSMTNWTTIEDCAINGLTVPATFGGALYFFRCDFENVAPILSQAFPFQVVLADCTNVPASFQNGVNCLMGGDIVLAGIPTSFTTVQNVDALLNNSGATTFGTLSVADLPTGGAIGTAATTVDVKTAIAVAQATAGQAATLPAPTDTTAGKVVIVSNTGTTALSVEGVGVGVGAAAIFIWNGASWADVSGGAGGGGQVFCDGIDPNAAGTVFSENFDLSAPDPALAGKAGVTYIAEDQSTWAYDGVEYVILDHLDKVKVKNVSGALIGKGSVVYISGASGSVPEITLADNTTEVGSSKTFGIVQADIADTETGWVVTSGVVKGVDLTGFAAGESLWLGTAGGYVNAYPVTPLHAVFIGAVIDGGSNGTLKVAIQNGFELAELHDVLDDQVGNPPLQGDIVKWDATAGHYVRDRQYRTTSIIPQHHNGTAWANAQAHTVDTVATAVLLSNGERISSGKVYWPGHLLSVGDEYYLDRLASGNLVLTKPISASYIVQPILTVLDENWVLVDIGQWSYVDGAVPVTAIVAQRFDGGWIGARANSSTTLCTMVKLDNGGVLRVKSGKARFAAPHGYPNGATLYLDTVTSGNIVAVKPTTGFVQPLGVVDDTTTVAINVDSVASVQSSEASRYLIATIGTSQVISAQGQEFVWTNHASNGVSLTNGGTRIFLPSGKRYLLEATAAVYFPNANAADFASFIFRTLADANLQGVAYTYPPNSSYSMSTQPKAFAFVDATAGDVTIKFVNEYLTGAASLRPWGSQLVVREV